MIGPTITDSTSQAGNTDSTSLHRTSVIEGLLIFLGAAILLFLFTTRIVFIFDEGILLTGTMQTMAGQILHRDFYYDYGPAQLYLLAGLFKVFGPSVLVERLTGAALTAGMVASVYILVRKFCGRLLALAAAIVSTLWSLGLALTIGMMSSGLAILILWTSWLVLPVSDERAQRRRAVGAGFLVGVIFLVRYDMAAGTIAANLIAIVAMFWLQEPTRRGSLRHLVATVILPYLAAFAITVIPFVTAYLSVAPLYDLLYDVVIYMGKYYRLGRGLPFPAPQLGPAFFESAVYLLPVIISFALWLAIRGKVMRRDTAGEQSSTPVWVNLLVSMGVAAAVLFSRGLVRVAVGGIYGTVVACVVLATILIEHRAALNRWSRGVLTAMIVLFVLMAGSCAGSQVFGSSLRPVHLKPMAINWMLTPNRQPPAKAFRSWCHEGSPITRGFCFVLDEDHIQTVRYLDEHTRPGDFLFVALDKNDRIIASDMITYFAAQRLPAVKWAQFDPFLENRADIQQEMIGELEEHRPPYVVLDSEFDDFREPNGSSVSTGVHLLDDYISAHYQTVQQYGELVILQRK